MKQPIVVFTKPAEGLFPVPEELQADEPDRGRPAMSDGGGPSIGLTRKFRPLKRSDERQWKTVGALVRHGFLFWSLGEPYPETLREVDAFAQRHADFIARERARSLDAYRQIEAALSRSG